MGSTHKLRRIICLMMAWLALILCSRPTAYAATSSEIQAQIDELRQEQKELQGQISSLEALVKENATQIGDIVENKNIIDGQIVLLYQQIEAVDAELVMLSDAIADTQEEVEDAIARYNDLNLRYKARIRAMEEQGSLSYWSVLFKASSYTEFLDRMTMVEDIARADQMRLRELQEARQQVETLQVDLVNKKQTHQHTAAQLQSLLADLEEKRAQADENLRLLIAKGDEYEALLDASEQAQDRLMQQLAQKESEYDDAAYKEWLESQPPVQKPENDPNENDAQPQKPAGSDKSQWLTPLPYYTLTSPFGNRLHPILNIWRMHNGVDMAAPANTEIYATRSGVVITASHQADGAGNYVQLDHGDGYRSIYMHMTRYVVSPGEYVQAGQVIGYVGSTGLSKGNHLHFGISYNGTYVNPMEYID